MFWGQALIEFRRTNKARSWPNFLAWHLKTDSKSAFATSLVGSRSPPSTTSFGISAFDMSRGTHPPTLPMSSRMHHFPNRRCDTSFRPRPEQKSLRRGFFPRLFDGGEARLNPRRDKVGDLWKLGDEQTHHGYSDKTRKPHPKIEA